MNKIDFYYSIISTMGLIANTAIIYYAITTNSKGWAILAAFTIAICIMNQGWGKREKTFLYGFIRGLTQDK